MDVNKIIKERATLIIWAVHIFVFLWVMGDGTVLSKNINKYFVYGAIVASLFVFDKLHKALLIEQNKCEEKDDIIEQLVKDQQEMNKHPILPQRSSAPFDFSFGEPK